MGFNTTLKAQQMLMQRNPCLVHILLNGDTSHLNLDDRGALRTLPTFESTIQKYQDADKAKFF